MFLRYVTSDVYLCCKSRSGCCTCCKAIHVCVKCMFQMFHSFQTNVASILSRCCKSRSRCCIYMYVASLCFKCFQVFHMYVCKYFIWMLHMFVLVFKCFQAFSQVFQTLVLQPVVSKCFKSRSGVAHGMRVRSGRCHGRRPRWRGITTGALLCEPNALSAHLLHVQAASGSDVRTLASLGWFESHGT
jgi:hypothetical protein